MTTNIINLSSGFKYTSGEVDGASAVGFLHDTANAFTTAGANLLRLSNNATTVLDFSFQGGIDHANSGASTAAHSQSLNLNWSATGAETSSGQYSVAIGANNTASQLQAIAIGELCAATQTRAVCVGYNSTASGDSAVSLGSSCTASGQSSLVSGKSNTVSGSYSIAGGFNAIVANASTVGYGCSSVGGGIAQTQVSSLHVATTDATQTTMLAVGTSLVIPADTTWGFKAIVVARSDETDGNVSGMWTVEGVLTRDESNNTAIAGMTATEVYSGFTTASVTASADDTNEALAIQVTGEASTNIRWVAKVDIAQVTYA